MFYNQFHKQALRWVGLSGKLASMCWHTCIMDSSRILVTRVKPWMNLACYKVKSSSLIRSDSSTSSTILEIRVRRGKLKRRLTVINFKSQRSLRVRGSYRTSLMRAMAPPPEIERIEDDFEDHAKRMSGLARSARSAVIGDRYPACEPGTRSLPFHFVI